MNIAQRITTHRILRIAAAGFMALLIHPIEAQSKAEKEAAILKYKGKFLVVKKDGIFMGEAGEGMCRPANPLLPRVLEPPRATATNVISDAEHTKVTDRFNCGVEPIHKGEVLKILDVHLFTVSRGSAVEKGGYLNILVQNVSPHSITRGIGAFEHPSMELGTAAIDIRAGNGKNFNTGDELATQWFTFMDSQDTMDAIKLGNTATGVFVSQVRSGMSFAEVESALGVPQTRVDLGEKVLYKYKDMTIEFHDGKVTDVR
jgi:hypothetical protein